jgi:hypothetical protein
MRGRLGDDLVGPRPVEPSPGGLDRRPTDVGAQASSPAILDESDKAGRVRLAEHMSGVANGAAWSGNAALTGQPSKQPYAHAEEQAESHHLDEPPLGHAANVPV